MNTPSSTVPESPLDPHAVTPAAMSETRPLYWSIRRELWENRSIYIAPLVVAGVVLLGFLIATIGRAVATVDPVQRAAVLAERNNFAAGVIMATAFIVGVFYCLDALHGERRDRSILFWKSLPVSDLTTVLSKASIPLVVLPLLTFAIIVVMQLIMLLLSTAVMLMSGLSVATLWTPLELLQMPLVLLYHLVTVHALWHAPIYAWLLLVSGWAPRAVFLWAVLPVIAIQIVEKIAFNTSYIAAMLGHRLAGPEGFHFTAPGSAPGHPLMTFDPANFLSTPGLWIGLAFAAAFLAAAVRLRRYQGPI
ncbi:MAG TPA: ABC transporter permease [Casimicrobiaceae bacterium]|nr:ABC transporter permease [Casimicrobiaceae bacterium]